MTFPNHFFAIFNFDKNVNRDVLEDNEPSLLKNLFQKERVVWVCACIINTMNQTISGTVRQGLLY